MASTRIDHTEREQARQRLETAYAEGRLTEPEFAEHAARAAGARTRDELSLLLTDLPGPADSAVPAAAGPASLRDRVGDLLTRALRRAVFCWLPPPRAGS